MTTIRVMLESPPEETVYLDAFHAALREDADRDDERFRAATRQFDDGTTFGGRVVFLNDGKMLIEVPVIPRPIEPIAVIEWCGQSQRPLVR